MVRIILFPVLHVLYCCISTFRRMCAVPNMTVVCRFLTLCFLGVLLRYFLNDFEMVTVAPISTGVFFFFIPLALVSIVRSVHFNIF